MSRRYSALVAAAALALSGCGSNTDTTTVAGTSTSLAPDTQGDDAAERKGAGLLDQWNRELFPTLLAARKRTELLGAGDLEGAADAEARMMRGVARVEEFAKEARQEFFGEDPSDVTQAVTEAEMGGPTGRLNWIRHQATEP